MKITIQDVAKKAEVSVATVSRVLNGNYPVKAETKEKVQRKALLNRDKAIKFQLQNFKYKVLDLEKKLIDLQVELAVERRKANPLLK